MILSLLLAALWAVPAFAIPLALIVAAELMCRAGDRERAAEYTTSVPADGAPLDDTEMRAFVGILRGWKERAPEPAHNDRRQP